MSRGLDHIVHAVRNLDAAVELYRNLGFQVGARNRHPAEWGTQNHVVQLPGTYIELLSIADMSRIVPHAKRHFSFGAFNRDFLARGEGLSMLVLAGAGVSDADRFRSGGIGDFAPYELRREAKRADGSQIRLAFTLVFASDPRAPEIGFFTNLHHNPENFWNAAFQVHDNTATGVAGVVLVAQDPNNHADFLSVFADTRYAQTPDGLVIRTPRGEIEVVSPDSFLRRYGVKAPVVARGARLAAIRFTVAQPSRLQAVPELAGMAGLYVGNAAVIGSEDAMGAVLIFEPAKAR
ncbi:MAG TPA: VOC family protein [Pseudolabrys sp.]|nr:VOC family protein [Pseudolabrys sp.]